jgi:hypothetical protein
MPVQLAWYHAPSVALMKFSGVVSGKDYQAAANRLYQWVEWLGAGKNHLLVDAQELVQMPSISELSRIRLHRERGCIIAFGVQNSVHRFAGSIAVQTMKMELRFVNTLEDAITMLRTLDPALEDLSIHYPPQFVVFDSSKARSV